MKNNRKLFIIFTIFVISMSLFLLNFMRIDSDYFWHIKAGEYMFNNKVLTHDIFSWYVNGKYWMSHEWLFEIIMYLNYYFLVVIYLYMDLFLLVYYY